MPFIPFGFVLHVHNHLTVSVQLIVSYTVLLYKQLVILIYIKQSDRC